MNPSRSVRKQELLAYLIVGVSLIWAAQVYTNSGASALWSLRSEPTYVCALGVLVWLTAKWRRVRHRNRTSLLTRKEIRRAELAMWADREATFSSDECSTTTSG